MDNSEKLARELKELKVYIKNVEKVVRLAKERHEESLYWQEWLSVRECAKKLKCRQDEVVDMVESCDELDLIVGFAIRGGHGSFDSIGDYLIEYIEDN